MKQIILLQSYGGGSNYIYQCDCDGRELDLEEVFVLGLITKKQWKKHYHNSCYIPRWYEIEAYATIRIYIHGADYNEENCEYTFIVPPALLVNPPQKIDYLSLPNIQHSYFLNQDCIVTKKDYPK